MPYYLIREYQKIYRADNNDLAPENLTLPAAAFDFLQDLKDTLTGKEIFRSSRVKGTEFLQAGGYTGVIETPDGTVLEILPKIYFAEAENAAEEVTKVRRIVLKMLRSLPDAPYRQLGEAYLRAAHLTLAEVFISAFIESVLLLVQGGLQQDYTLREANEPYLRGKLIFHKHLQANLPASDKFYTESDSFQRDIPHNRLLKTAIDFLLPRTDSYQNRNKLRQLQTVFAAVPRSVNIPTDFQYADTQNRLYAGYRFALGWARIFLADGSLAPAPGRVRGIALLFDLARLFERCTAEQFALFAENFEVITQDRSRVLLESGGEKTLFGLQPDIVLRSEEEVIILDTKWKIIDREKLDFGIARADLYQIFSYAKIYENDGRKVSVGLIYPQNPQFTESVSALKFVDRARTVLHIFSRDLAEDAATEIKNFLRLRAK